MKVDKIVDKAVKEIIEAFKAGGVPAAAAVYSYHVAFRGSIVAALDGKIHPMFIERICFKPKARR